MKIQKIELKNLLELIMQVKSGAVKIYEGQLLALNTIVKDDDLKKTIEEMKIHEIEHCRIF